MKKIVGLIFIIFFFIGCIQHEMAIHDMIHDMKKIQLSNNKNQINILWYKGSDKNYHYFAYVYSMTGTKHYNIRKGEMIIEKELALTADSTRWIRIKKIDDVWFASRKYNDVWKKELKGISIMLNKELKKRDDIYEFDTQTKGPKNDPK
jgi:hypothetical protein